MKRKLLLTIGTCVLGGGLILAVRAVEHYVEPRSDPAEILPDGAMLSIEADNFSDLLHAWNTSAEKRAWIAGSNYQEFSRSRLFTRLEQAQKEFAQAATVDPDGAMLESVAGGQSCLAIYDIGKMEFVYVTRMEAGRIQALPLWQARGKFERRNEAGSDFYLRKDEASGRQAVFAARDGWLILATRDDLIAGVLDRMAGKVDHNLANEAWYAAALKQAGARGELRMALNLTRLVPSPYFRSYWVQRNITEMKQYAAAVSDLRREGNVYREERVLVRRDASRDPVLADARPLLQLAPDDATLAIAEVATDREELLQNLREDLLELHPQQVEERNQTAPQAANQVNAGSASQLDVMIDQAPMVEARDDVDQPLRALLQAADPVRVLRCYTTAVSKDSVFVGINAAAVMEARAAWSEASVRQALTAALAPATTVGKLGAGWQQRTGPAGAYLALDGPVNLYLKVDGSRLFLASDAHLLESLLARAQMSATSSGENQTYVALYRNDRGRSDYLRLMRQLDRAGAHGEGGNSNSPAFFSANIGSLSSAFARLESEQVEERDQGARVLQTVTYRWKD